MRGIIVRIDDDTPARLRRRIQSVLAEGAQYAAAVWQRRAAERFQYATGVYVPSIGVEQVSEFVWRVSSSAPHALPLEEGYHQFDMKSRLRRSKGVKRVSRRGRVYRIVPFRHGVPGSVTIPPMPQAVFDAVSVGDPMPVEYLGTKYENMVKVQDHSRHTQYFTFRTLSEDGKPGTWLHPGVEPYNFIPEVLKEVLPIIRKNLGRAIKVELVGG